MLHYQSSDSSQNISVPFDMSSASPEGNFNTSVNASDTFEIQYITVYDFDGGKYTITKQDITPSDFLISFLPELNIPSAPILTATPGEGSITVTWPSVLDATGYNLYSSNNGSTWSQVTLDQPTSLSFNVSSLLTPTKRYYYAEAYNLDGTSDPSDTVSTTSLAIPVFVTAPEATSVVHDYNFGYHTMTTQFTCETVSGINYYEVWRGSTASVASGATASYGANGGSAGSSISGGKGGDGGTTGGAYAAGYNGNSPGGGAGGGSSYVASLSQAGKVGGVGRLEISYLMYESVS